MSKVLKVNHNAGFFSCCSIRLFEIINYFNNNKELPTSVDSSVQFQIHKSEPGDITNFFFETSSQEIVYEKDILMTSSSDEPQFSNYDLINFDEVKPFVEKYFKPSLHVEKTMNYFINNYGLELDKLCGVFYRGLDKSRETNIGSYDVWINKCLEIKNKYNVKFLVQTDESEFLNYFLQQFPDSIFIKELPTVNKSDTLLTNHVPTQDRLKFGIDFLSVTILLSKCNHLVTHSGNCGKWSCLFRGNTNNVYQYLTAGRNTDFNPNLIEYNYWTK